MLLIAAIILGTVATFLAFKTQKYSIRENKYTLKYRAYGVLLIYIGFVMHTLGDVLSVYSGIVELSLESIAHVIILVAFVTFYLASKKAEKKSRRYWFK